MNTFIRFIQKKYLYIVFWVLMLIPIIMMVIGIVGPERKFSLVKDSNRVLPDYLLDSINSSLNDYSNNHSTKMTIEIVEEIPDYISRNYGGPQLPLDRMPANTMLIPIYNNVQREVKPSIRLYITANGKLLCVVAPRQYIIEMKSKDMPETVPTVDGVLNTQLTQPWLNVNTSDQVADALKAFISALPNLDAENKSK